MGTRLLWLLNLLSASSFWLIAMAASPEEIALIKAITSTGPATVTLTKDVLLTADLPKLPNYKVLTVRGKCGVSGKDRCMISGVKKYSMFQKPYVSGVPVSLVLENLVITRAGKGGAAVSVNGWLTAKNVRFVESVRALQLSSTNGTASDCEFVRHSGGAASISGDQVSIYNFKFVNSMFASNDAARGKGGGAITVDKYALVTITKCRFTSNSAPDYRGGALRLLNAGAALSECTFLKNNAGQGGGAITAHNAYLTVASSVFQENYVENEGGGAVQISADPFMGTIASFDSCTFLNNKATNSFGAAFLLNTATSVTFCSPTFSGNVGAGGVMSNAYIVGPSNTIALNPLVPIPFLVRAPGAHLQHRRGSCA